MNNKYNVQLFKVLYGIILASIITLSISSIVPLFTESWRVLSIVYKITLPLSITLLIIWGLVFACKKFNRDFIKEWKTYFRNNRILFNIAIFVYFILNIVTCFIRMARLEV